MRTRSMRRSCERDGSAPGVGRCSSRTGVRWVDRHRNDLELERDRVVDREVRLCPAEQAALADDALGDRKRRVICEGVVDREGEVDRRVRVLRDVDVLERAATEVLRRRGRVRARRGDLVKVDSENCVSGRGSVRWIPKRRWRASHSLG